MTSIFPKEFIGSFVCTCSRQMLVFQTPCFQGVNNALRPPQATNMVVAELDALHLGVSLVAILVLRI